MCFVSRWVKSNDAFSVLVPMLKAWTYAFKLAFLCVCVCMCVCLCVCVVVFVSGFAYKHNISSRESWMNLMYTLYSVNEPYNFRSMVSKVKVFKFRKHVISGKETWMYFIYGCPVLSTWTLLLWWWSEVEFCKLCKEGKLEWYIRDHLR